MITKKDIDNKYSEKNQQWFNAKDKCLSIL